MIAYAKATAGGPAIKDGQNKILKEQFVGCLAADLCGVAASENVNFSEGRVHRSFSILMADKKVFHCYTVGIIAPGHFFAKMAKIGHSYN